MTMKLPQTTPEHNFGVTSGPDPFDVGETCINRHLAENVARARRKIGLTLPSGVPVSITRMRWEAAFSMREHLKSDPVFWSALRLALGGMKGLQALFTPSRGLAYMLVEEEIKMDNRTAEQLASLWLQAPDFVTAMVAEILTVPPEEVRKMDFVDVLTLAGMALALEFNALEQLAQDFFPQTPPASSDSNSPGAADSVESPSTLPLEKPTSDIEKSTDSV